MPRPKVQRNEIKYKYSKHDIVWAKTAGYRWWPASITSLPSRNKCFYKVDFIGDRSYALLSEEKLAPFLHYRDEYSLNKKNDKHFSNAVTIAAKKYEELVLKQAGSLKGRGSLESKSSQLKQQLNQQIQLPQIPENIQQISSLNQSLILSPAQQLLSPNNTNVLSAQPLEDHLSIDKHTERSPTLTLKPSGPIEPYPLSQDEKTRENFIQQLLVKYKLNSIPDLKQVRKNQKQIPPNEKKRCHWKKKLIIKANLSSNHEKQEAFGQQELLTRKIYRFLLKKLHSPEQSRTISLNLKDQILREKVEKAGCLKKVVQWIGMTDAQNIVNFYPQWINFYKDTEREREKHSNLTMEDENESISIK